MIFRSKVDTYFIIFISITVLLMGVVVYLPLLIDKEATISIVIIMSAIFIISVGFILWSAFSIKYIFNEDYLLVKGGPFRSKVPYQAITKISLTNNIFTGYRILSSKNGIEIFYSSTILGSIKISPKNKSRVYHRIKKAMSQYRD
ncbi:PH domain-containing protein [Paraliobacillus zengyii]|uniref:PH domain-containing protein n=1 Tax=Paraliobacillus TaxID=200903 RepID=UPI002FCD7774